MSNAVCSPAASLEDYREPPLSTLEQCIKRVFDTVNIRRTSVSFEKAVIYAAPLHTFTVSPEDARQDSNTELLKERRNDELKRTKTAPPFSAEQFEKVISRKRIWILRVTLKENTEPLPV